MKVQAKRSRDGALVTATGEPVSGDPALDVEVDVVHEDGRLIAQAVRVSRQPGGPPVTSAVLRSVAVSQLISFAGHEIVQPPSADDVQYVRDNGPTGRTIEIVAWSYRAALLLGSSPTKMVERWFGIPRSTAGRWIAEARTRGLLGRSKGQGKVGA